VPEWPAGRKVAETCQLSEAVAKDKVASSSSDMVNLSGSPVSVDVGLCRSLPPPGGPGFPRKSPLSDFHRTLKERPRPRPARPRGEPPSEGCCPPGSRCGPSRLLVQELRLQDRARQVEVVEGCQCHARPEQCLRSPALKTFFPDSPLEQTLDVGRCAALPPSPGGPFCVPTGFDSVLLQGPNGKRLVRTLGGCRAQGASCSRLPHWDHYAEVVLDADGTKRQQWKVCSCAPPPRPVAPSPRARWIPNHSQGPWG
ncbi:hypothetical protein E2320_022211, partial [Naja naja]